MNNPHNGHRKRLKQRFIKDNGMDHFEEHQILEMILFYAVHMKDTNELAHKMINEFGSFYNLLDSSPIEIQNRCNVSEHVAVLVSMFPHVFRRYLQSKMNGGNIVIDNSKTAAEYLRSLMLGKNNECFYVLCLDVKKRLTNAVKISEGTIDRTQVFPRNIIKAAINHNAHSIIIAHNHPGGTCKPSKADLSATEKIQRGLSAGDIELLDHIIICDDHTEKYFSFAEKKLFNLNLIYEDS